MPFWCGGCEEEGMYLFQRPFIAFDCPHSGTEVFLDSLSTRFNRDHGFMLGAIQCQRVPRELRDRIGTALAQGKAKVFFLFSFFFFFFLLIVECCPEAPN